MLLICGAALRAWGDSVTPAKILSAVKSATTWPPGITEDEKQKISAVIEREVNARFTTQIEVLSPSILSEPLDLRFSDAEYIDLAVRLHVAQIRGIIEFQKIRSAILAGGKREALNANIDAFSEGLRSLLKDKLTGAPVSIPASAIDSTSEKIKGELLRLSNDESLIWMTKPLSADEMRGLLKDLGDRVDASINTVVARIGKIQELPNGPSVADRISSVQKAALNEIAGFSRQRFLEATTDPTLKTFNPDSVVPGFRELSNKLQQKVEKLQQTTSK
jgi:hypothetical protein